MGDQESRLLEHFLNIVDLITQELKDVKTDIASFDKMSALAKLELKTDIARIDGRLKIAEKLLIEMKAAHDSDRIENAETRGSNGVKWVILAAIGGGIMAFAIPFAMNAMLA